ncbi:hypothetical protein C8R47DRAFT_1190570 [Mycena vitilis]|nr:hypothetical protein C8R47DRAFT_1190570 [Mycena vitilis]
MFSLQSVLSPITSYRLGYASQRPYPWRWATPCILAGFLVISVFLILLNIPLAAYEIVQEATYRPNDTLPPLLFSNLLPKLLQTSGISFSPQILTVGETFFLNNSMFNVTIIDAWDETLSPVKAFSYYNNPFSDGCDVVVIGFPLSNMTWDLGSPATAFHPFTGTFSLDVLCLHGTSFLATLTPPPPSFSIQSSVESPRDVFNALWSRDWLNSWGPIDEALDLDTFSVTVVPCCDCDGNPETARSFTLRPTALPCRGEVTRLVGSQSSISLFSLDEAGVDVSQGSFSSLIFDFPDWTESGHLKPYHDALTQSAVNDAAQNVFQALYHLARMELGIILENQIFASPAMFNETISPVSNISQETSPPFSNQSRIATSNVTVMKHWADTVQFFNTTERVPVISYVRQVPQRKPLGSAFTSVFASTFAMISALWTVFSIVAGVIAARSEGASKKADGPSIEDSIATHGAAISRMELSFARMQLTMRKRGLLEEGDEEDSVVEAPSADTSTSGHEEKSTLLVHHKHSDSSAV